MSTLADLFARDPLKLTKEDRSQIIAHFRANRQAFMINLKEPKPKAAAKVKVPKEKVQPGALNLDDLDI